MKDIATIIQIFSIVSFFYGLYLISFLQIKLSRKMKKSFLTFISVLIYPKEKLSEKDIKTRKISCIILLFSSIIAVICDLIREGY